jgi:long-subunit acyl-CoA synthetase (AMP-forming)
VKGRNVFMGYLKNEKENLEVFDVEGYFHTGDMGYLDQKANN